MAITFQATSTRSAPALSSAAEVIVHLLDPNTGFDVVPFLSAMRTNGEAQLVVVINNVPTGTYRLFIQFLDASGATVGFAIPLTSVSSGQVSEVVVQNSVQMQTITVSPSFATIALGATQEFGASAIFNDGSSCLITGLVTWSSGSPSVATIDARGTSTAQGAGTAIIGATFGSIAGKAPLTVGSSDTPTPTLTGISVTPPTPSVPKGLTQQFTAIGTYSNGSTANLTSQVTWSSNAPAVSISNASGTQGLASAASLGNATISAALNGRIGSATMSVTAAVPVTIQVTPPQGKLLQNGNTLQFTATGTMTDNSVQNVTQQVTWMSSITASATISNATGHQGVATSVSAGSTTITASQGTAMGSATLRVFQDTLYVANANSNNLSAFTINTNTGALTQIAASPFGAGTFPDAVAADPFDRFLYAANQSGNNVSAFAINPASGALAAVTGSPFAAGSSPTGVTVDPMGQFVYQVNASGNDVSAYGIDMITGALTAVAGSPFSSGTTGQGVVVDPTDSFAYVVNFGSNNITGYDIDATTGALTQMTGSPFASGTDPAAVAIDPSGHFLFATNSGSNTVSGYRIGSGGALTAVAGSPFAAGSLPQGITTVSASGNTFVFVANANDNTLTSYEMNASTGVLTQVTGSPFATGSTPTGVWVESTGSFVYVTNSSDNTVSGYQIDTVTGALTQVSGSPFATGSVPAAVVSVP